MAEVSFPKAIQLALQYLQSVEFSEREDATSTLHSLSKILEMNRRGLLSEDSQEGEISIHYRERAYVFGFMMRDKARKLITNLGVHTDKICFITPVDSVKSLDNPDYSGVQGIPLTVHARTCKVITKCIVSMPQGVFDHYRHLRRIKPHPNLVYMVAFDPLYGRRADSPKGLWSDLLRWL